MKNKCNGEQGIFFTSGDLTIADVKVAGGFKPPANWIDMSEYVVNGKVIIHHSPINRIDHGINPKKE